MRSVWLMAWNNLRRRKGQALLVGVVMGLSGLLLITGLGVTREIDGPLEIMFEEQVGSHFTLNFDVRIHDPDRVRSWWTGRPEVASVTPAMPMVDLTESAFYDGLEMSRFFSVVERPPVPLEQDLLRFVDGDPAPYPGPGEIWISTSLAGEADIEAGTTLQIPGSQGLRDVLVSGVVVDPQFSSLFNNPTRTWIGPGELVTYFSATRLSDVMIGIRLHEGTDYEALWGAFLDELGGVYSGGVMDPEDVRNGYVAPYALMAVLLIAFSGLGLLVALFAIHGTITSAVLADFKVIGILRSHGFRPRDVRLVYELQYLFLALVFFPLGALAGVLVVRQSIAFFMSNVATPVGLRGLIGLSAILLPLLTLGVYAFVRRVSRQAGRIRPAEAIRYGAIGATGGARRGMALQRLKRLSVPMIVGLKNLALNKRRSVFLAISVTFATVAAALAINLDHSMQAMRTDLVRFGFDGADVRIDRSGRRFGMRHEALMAALTSRDDVAAVATWDFIDATLPLPGSGRQETLPGTLVDGDMEGLQYQNLRGRNPVGPTEISLAVNTAKRFEKDVGDVVDVHLMGTRLRLTVVGVYQTINNTGHGFRVRLEALQTVNPLWTPEAYGLALADGVAPLDFIEEIEGEYGEAVDAKLGDFFVRDQLRAILTGMRTANGFLAAVFLLAAAVFIFNTTLLTIAENRRIYGIMKAGGMTPAQLRASVVWGVGVQAGLGVAAGLLAWGVGARFLLSSFFGTVGLVEFPLDNWELGTALLVPVVLGFCLASAWMPSSRVLEINPRALIVE